MREWRDGRSLITDIAIAEEASEGGRDAEEERCVQRGDMAEVWKEGVSSSPQERQGVCAVDTQCE